MKSFQFVDQAIGADQIETRLTNDGYLVGTAKCARTGIQIYGRSELGLSGAGTVNVYRPDEAVFNRDSMASYAGKPVTLGHPSVPVNSKNWKDHSVGQLGEEVTRDGESIRVQFAIMDSNTIDQVKGGVCQISMGYTTPVEMRDGVAPCGTPYQAVQTGPIRINHFAIVDAGRAGETCQISRVFGDGN